MNMKYLQIAIMVCLSLLLSSCFNVDEEELVEDDAIDSTFWSVISDPGVSFKTVVIRGDNSAMLFVVRGVASGKECFLYQYDTCGNQIGIVNLDSVYNYQNIGEPYICAFNEEIFVLFKYFYGLLMNNKGEVTKSIALESDEKTTYEEIDNVKRGGTGCLIETYIEYSEIYHGEEHFMTGRNLIRTNQLGDVVWSKRTYCSAFAGIGTGLESIVYLSNTLHCLNRDGEIEWKRECEGIHDLFRLENGTVLLIKEGEIACITEENEVIWSIKGSSYDKFDSVQDGGFIKHTYKNGIISIVKYDDNGTVDNEFDINGPEYKEIKLINDSTLAVLTDNKFEILKIPN